MKKFLSLFLPLVVLVACSGNKEKTWDVVVANPTDDDQTDRPVVVNLGDELSSKFRLASAVVMRGDEEIPCQWDDLDDDGRADELVFTATLKAGATDTFHITCRNYGEQTAYTPRVRAFLKLWDQKFQYPEITSITFKGSAPALDTYNAIYGHGAQWESELVGFRVYMDHRQSIDIYGKPYPQLVLDETHFYSTREDIAAGKGCDILFAGQSVGAASFRGYVEEQPTYVDSVRTRGQRIIADGPVRCIVEVTDQDWAYQGHLLQMRQRYTLYAGHRDVQVDIDLMGETDDDLFCTGVQKLEFQNEGFITTDDAGALGASWGVNIPDKAAEDLEEGVGLAVFVPSCYVEAVREDALNYLCVLRPVGHHITYRLAICAAMEQEGFHASGTWFDWVRLCWK